MGRTILHGVVLLLVACVIISYAKAPSPSSSQAQPSPTEFKVVADQLVQVLETLDAPKVLDLYTDDFISGTGRTRYDLRRALLTLGANHVTLKVERAEIEAVKPTEAQLSTQMRLHYKDRFRGLDGEVAVTDALVHSFRKEEGHWKVYTDERIATYREARFGNQPPQVEIEVPQQMSDALRYPVTVSVRREAAKSYQVIVGNYVDDTLELPAPEVSTQLPENGVLQTRLSSNSDGFSEMVRVTVLATDRGGTLVGATIVSKLIHGAPQNDLAPPKQAV